MGATIRAPERPRERRLAGLLAEVLDPVILARRAGIEPDPWQAEVLRSAAPRVWMNCARQAGKSTVTSILALHTVLYRAEALVLLLSPGLRQSGEIFKKCLATYKTVDRPVPAASETALTLTLANGSRIVSLPGADDTIRGYSDVDLLVIDEAARVKTSTYSTVRPMLAVSNGRLVTLSTPDGARGWWYEAGRSDEPWERYTVPASACPRISPAFLLEEQRTHSEQWYRQEYCCDFADAESQAFRTEDVNQAFREEVDPWDL